MYNCLNETLVQVDLIKQQLSACLDHEISSYCDDVTWEFWFFFKSLNSYFVISGENSLSFFIIDVFLVCCIKMKPFFFESNWSQNSFSDAGTSGTITQTWHALRSTTVQLRVSSNSDLSAKTKAPKSNIQLKTFHASNSSPTNQTGTLFNLSKKRHQTSRPTRTSAASVLLVHRNVRHSTFLNPSSPSLPKTHRQTIWAHRYS